MVRQTKKECKKSVLSKVYIWHFAEIVHTQLVWTSDSDRISKTGYEGYSYLF